MIRRVHKFLDPLLLKSFYITLSAMALSWWKQTSSVFPDSLSSSFSPMQGMMWRPLSRAKATWENIKISYLTHTVLAIWHGHWQYSFLGRANYVSGRIKFLIQNFIHKLYPRSVILSMKSNKIFIFWKIYWQSMQIGS